MAMICMSKSMGGRTRPALEGRRRRLAGLTETMDDATGKNVAAVQSDDLRRAIEEGDEELQRALELSLRDLTDDAEPAVEHDETFTATTGASKDTPANGVHDNTSNAEASENNAENGEAKRRVGKIVVAPPAPTTTTRVAGRQKPASILTMQRQTFWRCILRKGRRCITV